MSKQNIVGKTIVQNIQNISVCINFLKGIRKKAKTGGAKAFVMPKKIMTDCLSSTINKRSNVVDITAKVDKCIGRWFVKKRARDHLPGRPSEYK